MLNASRTTRRVVITGVTGFRNRGVEALVKPVVEGLLQEFSDLDIDIVTLSPQYDALRLTEPRVRFFQDHWASTGTWAPSTPPNGKAKFFSRVMRRLLRLINLQPITHLQKSTQMPFDQPDLLIVTGGDILSGDYGTPSLRHWAEPIRWARANGVRSVILSHSIGRFKTDEEVAIWNQIEDAATEITLREPLSLQYLTTTLKKDPNRYRVTADVAFLLNEDLNLKKRFSSAKQLPRVALSINAGITKFTQVDPSQHFRTWIEMIQMILNNWKAELLLIPHVQEPYGDDRVLATEIARHFNFDPRITVLAEDLSAEEYKGAISVCEMLVAERMHAAIAGLSTGVPTVAIGYSIKAEGILSSVLEGTSIKPSQLGMQLKEFLNVDTAKEKLESVWKQRDLIRKEISSTISRSQNKANENLELLREMLRSQ